MNPLTTIAALALAAFGLMAWACWRASRSTGAQSTGYVSARVRSGSRTTVDEDKVEEAIRYAHDTGFDEGYKVGWQDGFDEGVASRGALDHSADDRLEDEG